MSLICSKIPISYKIKKKIGLDCNWGVPIAVVPPCSWSVKLEVLFHENPFFHKINIILMMKLLGMEKTRYLFKFYYIGAKEYFGSQRQPDYLTIEDCLLTALQEKNYMHEAKTSGFEVASRTDKFVSARGSTFSFITEKTPILMEINSALPKNIGVWAYSKVPTDFYSRYNAQFRHYKYIMPYPKAILKDDSIVNMKAMKKVCKALEGRHNFKNFSKQGKEKVKNVRDMIATSINTEGNFIIFDFKSRAFLRQQIRRMVAKILEVGFGKTSYEEFIDLFDPSKDISYQPADPFGLILWDINYGNNVSFVIDNKSKERRDKYFREQEQNFSLKKKLFNFMQHNNIG